MLNILSAIQFQEIDAFVALIIIMGSAFVYYKVKIRRTDAQKRQDVQNQFNKVVAQLSDKNETTKLSAAIILRRFFKAEIDQEHFKKEAVNVISSLLKILPTGIFQKTLGDGLAYAKDLSYSDLQRTNLQDLYIGIKNTMDDEQEKQKTKKEREEELEKYKDTGEGLTEAILKDIDTNNTDSTKEKKQNQQEETEYNSWKIKLDFTDMFGANLSYALIENVSGYGTIFYGAILMFTQIKNCEFINANFCGADLTGVYFKNVILTGANFKNAINIPETIKEHLIDGIYHDIPLKGTNEEKRINAIFKENDYVPRRLSLNTTDNNSPKTIFFSMPGSLNKSDEYLINYFRDILEKDEKFKVRFYTRDHYPQDSQLTKVKLAIMQSDAMVAFGLKQIRIQDGCARPGLKLQKTLTNEWFPTPWNEIEVGMAMMANLPILLVRDKEIQIGVFDQNLNEYRMNTIVTNDAQIYRIKENEAYLKWIALIKRGDDNSNMILASEYDFMLDEFARNIYEAHSQTDRYDDLQETDKQPFRLAALKSLKLLKKNQILRF